MHVESRRILAARKMDRKPSAVDRWTALERKPIRTVAEQSNGSPTEHQSTSGQGQTRKGNRRSTVKKYLDRITIAGLHNYLFADGWCEKVTWNLTFLIAIVGTMFYLGTTIRSYLEFTIVLDIQQKVEPSVHLPSVWVCTEAINVSYISEQFDKVRPKLLVDRRIRQHAKWFMRYATKPNAPFYTQWNSTTMTYDTVPSVWNPNTTTWEFNIDDIIDKFILWSKHFSIISPIGDDFGLYTYVAHILDEVLYRAVELAGTNWLGYKTYYEEGMFSCESVIKNCTFNGVAFDCCASGSMGYSQATARCFRLDVNQTTLGIGLQQASSSSITLSFETIIDSLHFREFHSATYASVSSDAAEISEALGISVSFGPRMPGLFEISQFLAPATLSTIMVQAIQKIERTGCVQAYRFDPRLHANSHPLIINYFKQMVDPKQYTVGTCDMGKLLDTIYIQCGCVLYYDTIRPQNDSDICTPAHMYGCLYRTFHDVAPNDNAGAGTSSVASASGSAEDELKRATMLHLKAASATECQSLCESWTYDFRASSMIAAGPEGNISRYFRNKVVIIIDPEYRVETEVYKMDYLTLAASLGVAFGCILGISAITLIQFPIWTIVAIVMRSKLNKVSPLSRQGAIHCRQLQSKCESAM